MTNPSNSPILTHAYSVNWVDAERFLFVSDGTLRLQHVGKFSVLVDDVYASWYDYTTISPLPSPTSPDVKAQEAAANSQWIALIELDGNVWLVDAVSGEKKQITQDGAPQTVTGTAKQVISYCCFSWSSDGKLLAFGRTDYRETTMDSSVLIYDMERGEAKAMPKMQSRAAWPSGLARIYWLMTKGSLTRPTSSCWSMPNMPYPRPMVSGARSR